MGNESFEKIRSFVQQKQIEDLEQKVDIILEHNEKLASENAELKQRITDN